MHCEWTRAGLSVNTDPDLLDIDLIHHFLAQSVWARGIPRGLVERAIANSLNFGLYGESRTLLGYGRVVSDRATFAYISDVLIVPEHRRKGLGSWLIECMLTHPELQGLRRWQLTSTTAQEFYAKLGFTIPPNPLAGLAMIDPLAYSGQG